MRLFGRLAEHAAAGTFDQKQKAAGKLRNIIHEHARAPTPSVATGEIVERAKEAADFLRGHHIFCTARDGRFATTATLIEQQAATIAELREALERARPYVANVVEAEGAEFNRRDLFAIDTTLNRSNGS